MYNNNMDKKISEKVISRLTLYHCILREFITQEQEYISSKQIATLLRIDDSQVRKDLNLLNNSGKTRVGYNVKELKTTIERTLGYSKTKNTCIIGAGNLGMALAKYDNFTSYGLNVVAMFDNDSNKIGNKINDKEILDINNLSDFVKNNEIDIAILTVPSKYAQQTADLIVNSNIKYIWNFTSRVLKVPDDVQVWNENLMGNFLQFTYNI
jgi:redox-sensing transcriptional repressor